jgi:hypothetical protein
MTLQLNKIERKHSKVIARRCIASQSGTLYYLFRDLILYAFQGTKNIKEVKTLLTFDLLISDAVS